MNMFGRIEVFAKKLKTSRQKFFSQVKMYLDKERQTYIFDTIKFILFYGILINLILYLFGGFKISILNILGGGAGYYILTDLVDLFAEKKFILFRGDKK